MMSDIQSPKENVNYDFIQYLMMYPAAMACIMQATFMVYWLGLAQIRCTRLRVPNLDHLSAEDRDKTDLANVCVEVFATISPRIINPNVPLRDFVAYARSDGTAESKEVTQWVIQPSKDRQRQTHKKG